MNISQKNYAEVFFFFSLYFQSQFIFLKDISLTVS